MKIDPGSFEHRALSLAPPRRETRIRAADVDGGRAAFVVLPPTRVRPGIRWRSHVPRWRPGDYIVDRFDVTAGRAPGSYHMWVGFFTGGPGTYVNATVTRGAHDPQNRVEIGRVVVEYVGAPKLEREQDSGLVGGGLVGGRAALSAAALPFAALSASSRAGTAPRALHG